MKIQKIYLFLPVSRSKILRFLVIFFFFFLFRYFMKTFSRFFDKRICKILCKSTVKNRPGRQFPLAVPFLLYAKVFSSRMMVNGPSLQSSTFITAPNFPCSTIRNSLPAACKHIFIRASPRDPAHLPV